MLVFLWLFFICPSAAPLELEELLNEISWTVRLKLLSEMSTTTPPAEEIPRGLAPLPNRRVGIESLVERRDEDSWKRRQTNTEADHDAPVAPIEEVSPDENKMRLKLFRLMYETVRDSDLKVKRAELIQEHYSNTTTFQIGYLMGDVTDKFTIMTDISTTLERFYDQWRPIEHINAYEQIANQAIEISHLIDLIRMANKRDHITAARERTKRFHFTVGSQQHYWWKYDEQLTNAQELSTRLNILMHSYYEDASQRMTEYNHIRFMYEESPHYEMGYVMHEIIERYRKMVEQMRRAAFFKSNTFFDQIERLELIQKLYFEIYHLVNMLHEIPPKWKQQEEFSIKKPINKTAHFEAMQGMAAMNDRKKKEARELKKLLKKRRELLEKGRLVHTAKPPGSKRVPYNIHWPLDYGWDIDWW